MEYLGISFGLFLSVILILFLYLKYRQTTNWMIAGTWVIALMAIGSGISAVIYYSKQINELEKSRRFEWRPFLDIDHISKNNKIFFAKLRAADSGKNEIEFNLSQYAEAERLNVAGFDNLINDIKEKEDIIKRFDEISTRDSLLFSRIDTLLIPSGRKIQYNNLGKTPLRIRNSYISVLTEKEWVNDYHKSARELIKDIPNKREYSGEWEIDYVVKSLEKKESVEYPHLKLIPIDEFFEYFKRDSTMTVYWVSHFEYEDFFGYIYNTLLIEYEIYNIYLDNNHFIIGSKKAGMEKYRWDVGIE